MTLPVINKYSTKILPVIFILLFIATWTTPFNQSSINNRGAGLIETGNEISNGVSSIFDDEKIDSNIPEEGISKIVAEEDYPVFTDETDTDVQMTLNNSEFIAGQTVAVNITSSASSWITLNGTMVWTLTSPDNEEVFQANVTMDKVLNTTLVDDNATETHSFYNAGFTNQTTWNSQTLDSTLMYNSTTIQNVTYFSSGTKIVTNTTYPGYMNFTIDLPLYSAIIGTWEFEVFLNNTNADGYSSQNRWYTVYFAVTDEFEFILDDDNPVFTDETDTDVQMILNSSEYIVGQTVAVSITSSATSWLTLNGTMVWTLTSPDNEEVFQANVTMDKVLNTTLVDDNATEIHSFYNAGFINQTTWNTQVLKSTLRYNSTTLQNVTYLADETKTVTNTTYPGYMNFTIDLPLYPAILGTWEFEVFLNNTHANGYSSRYRWYTVEFVVTDEVKYSHENTYAERGFYDDNGTIRPYHANETGITVYSPGDNITFIGSFAYNTTTNTLINTSAYTLTSTINFIYGEDEWSSNAYLRFYDNETVDIPQGNLTTPYNNSYYTALNFKIPYENIYGEVNITIRLTFQYTGFGQSHTVSIDLTPITVKYHLYLEAETTPESSTIYITEKVNGSVTFVTTQWNTTLETIYGINNYTAGFLIPISDLNVDIFQYMDSSPGTELQLFEITLINYSIFWSIDIGIDHQQELGSYTLKLRWLSPDNVGEDTKVYLADDGITEYEYQFSISEGTWSIVNLTGSYNFTIDVTENVVFHLKVDQTDFIVNYDRNLTVDNHDIVYSVTMYEYRIPVTPAAAGSFELIVRWDNGTELDRITYTAVAAEEFIPKTEAATEIESPISNTDILMILGIAVTILVLAVALLKFLPRY